MEIGYSKTAKQYYSDPLLGNLLNAVFKKYQGQNGVRGNAKIVVKSVAEAFRLQDFFGDRVRGIIRPNVRLEMPLKIFAEDLNHGFKLTIPDLYEVLYDTALLTNSEQRQLKEEQWNELFERVNLRFEQNCKASLNKRTFSEKIYNWFDRLKEGDAPGYQIVKSVLRNGGAGDDELFYCVKALWYLFHSNDELREELKICTQNVRIPIFSNFVTKDSHRLDLKFPAGRLLLAALEDIYAQKIRTGEIASNEHLIVPEFMKRRQIYRTFGLMDDDISSISHVFASSFIYGTSPRTLNLREIESREDWPKYSALYIFENPSVFSFLYKLNQSS